jgi:hypothetical protein
MSMPGPDDGKKRISRGVKLAIMGVGGAALLYSCAPAIGGVTGLSALPLLWGMGNPFYRGPVAPNCAPGAPGCAPDQSSTSRGGSGSGSRSGITSGSSSTSSSATSGSSSAGQSTSSRGGFGSSASAHGSGSS